MTRLVREISSKSHLGVKMKIMRFSVLQFLKHAKCERKHLKIVLDFGE